MTEEMLEQKIKKLDDKLDVLLEHVNEQRLRSQSYEDLISDLSIVGKDVYDSSVNELDKQSVEIDPAMLTILLSKTLKNLPNMSLALDSFESLMDLVKDAGPIANEVIIDLTKKLHEMDSKGYFTFFREFSNILDNIITHFSPEDVKLLADNVVTILETIKSLTQPEMMQAVNNAVQVFNSVEQEEIPSYSMFRAIREMNKPEMKKAIGFMMVFLKNISQNDKLNKK